MEPRRPYGLSAPRRPLWLPVLLVFAVLSVVPSLASAQLMINKGAVIVTKPSSFMQINGAYQNQTGSIDDSGTITITSDFTNNTAATSSNSGIYNIAGNFTDDGTFNKKTGTVDLYGGSNQNVGGAVVTTFYNLQFTGGGSKTLTQKEIVDSNCYFTNGICYSTQTDVLHFDVQGNWINNSGMPTSACVSYVDGPCEKEMNSTNLFWFPVGESGRANTCAITPQSATATTFRTRYFDSSFYNTISIQSPLVSVSDVQFWYGDIVTPNPGGANAIIRLYWIPGDYTASEIQAVSGLLVARWDTLAPIPPGPRPAWVTAGESAIMPGATYNSGWIESAVVIASKYGTNTINRAFTLSTDSIDNSLPVQMGPFSARQVGNSVVLDWRTYSEIELRGFELDRSQPLGQSGNSVPQEIQSFQYDTALLAKSPWGAEYETADDSLHASGVYTYDLYEIDQDGIRTHVADQTVDFSEIAIPNELNVTVFPNPAVGSTSVEFGLPTESPVTIDLYDVTGRLAIHEDVGDELAGPHEGTLDLSHLSAGTYNLIISAAGERVMKNIVVMR